MADTYDHLFKLLLVSARATTTTRRRRAPRRLGGTSKRLRGNDDRSSASCELVKLAIAEANARKMELTVR